MKRGLLLTCRCGFDSTHPLLDDEAQLFRAHCTATAIAAAVANGGKLRERAMREVKSTRAAFSVVGSELTQLFIPLFLVDSDDASVDVDEDEPTLAKHSGNFKATLLPKDTTGSLLTFTEEEDTAAGFISVSPSLSLFTGDDD
jgi:hypothetical protein